MFILSCLHFTLYIYFTVCHCVPPHILIRERGRERGRDIITVEIHNKCQRLYRLRLMFRFIRWTCSSFALVTLVTSWRSWWVVFERRPSWCFYRHSRILTRNVFHPVRTQTWINRTELVILTGIYTKSFFLNSWQYYNFSIHSNISKMMFPSLSENVICHRHSFTTGGVCQYLTRDGSTPTPA